MSGHEDGRVMQTVNVDLGGGDGTQMATLAEATIGPDGQIILTGEDGTQSSEYSHLDLLTLATNFLLLTAFPMSGMVTIPVSMYQTVVTNIQNMTEAGIPVTAMSALTAAATNEGNSEVQENDASTTTQEDVKVSVNGNQSSEETESH
jgi:hypothetical protein